MRAIGLAFAILLGSASAWAAPAPKDDLTRKIDICFPVTITGELQGPHGSYLTPQHKASFPSMIRLRANFVPELTKSLDVL